MQSCNQVKGSPKHVFNGHLDPWQPRCRSHAMVEAFPFLVDRRVLRQTDDILLGFPVVCFFGRLLW